jgi:mannose-1-phosphate guanylyltransferase
LIPIAGKPVLYHVLDLLPSYVEEAVFATGYKADVISEYVRQRPPRLRVQMVTEQEPLGTGGGMKNAGAEVSDPFVLLNADVIASVDLSDILAAHHAHSALGTMVLTEVDDIEPYGVAALGENDRIVRFVEKPKLSEAPSHWINAGIAVWNRRVIESIPAGRPVSFEREILPGLLREGVFGFRARGFWEDAGTPQRLLNAQRLLFEAGRAEGEGVPTIADGKGPACVGEGSLVQGVRFGKYVTVGREVRIGSGTYLENSVIMDGVQIGEGARISGSILGPGLTLPEGQELADQVLAAGRPS